MFNELLQQLSKYSNIQQVFLVQKEMKYLVHLPCYVLGFSLKKGFGKVNPEAIVQTAKVLHENVTFPGETFLLSFDVVENNRIKKKIKRVANAKII